MPRLTITEPGTLMALLVEREITTAEAEAITQLLDATEPPLLIKARVLSNAETADIAVTAAEGGINYWARAVSPYDYTRWEKPEGGDNRDDLPDDFVFYRLRYENPKDDGMLESDITPELIRRGIALVVQPPTKIRDDLEAQVLDAVRSDPDDVDIDSEAADCIVQLGIFGEVVFG